MNVEIMVQWLRRLDYKLIRVGDTWWYNAGPRTYQALPYHSQIVPSATELRTLFRQAGAISLRYFAPVDCQRGVASYHVVFDGDAYSMETLRSNSRRKVRRGLKECRVEPISLERLACEGWPLQRDTLERQGRATAMNEQRWQQICHAACGLPGFEAWGALIDDALVASILLLRVGDTFMVLYVQSDRRYLDRYINNALCYTISQELHARPGIRQIFYSTQSLDAPASVDEFKFTMGYRAQPVRQVVTMHPLAAPMCNWTTYKLGRLMMERYMQPAFTAKIDGIVRLYLHSKPSALAAGGSSSQ